MDTVYTGEMPDSFLQDEIREGYLVKKEMKAVWKVQLDILSEIMRICDVHSIKYFAIGGTLLGAMRHSGYIPWDDDIDIGMLRPDYDRFVAIAQSELPAHLFLQTSRTEKGYYFPWAKVKDSRTTAFDDAFVRDGIEINYGIFVDVFPIDGAPSADMADVARFRSLAFRVQHMMWLIVAKCESCGWRDVMYRILGKCLGWDLLAVVRDYLFGRISVSATEYVICGDGVMKPSRLWESAWFRDVCRVKFEYLQIPVPVDYGKLLTCHYGDWHVFERGSSLHNGLIRFDPNRSYKEVRESFAKPSRSSL